MTPATMNAEDAYEDLRSHLDASAVINDFRWTPSAREMILSRVYRSFLGNHANYFISEPLPSGKLLSAHQAETNPRYGADIPGMPCGHIFRKGDCCYKCKDCALDDSCVLCSRCFHGSSHEGHNVSFYLAIQPGGCCDCGDPEAWKADYGCAYHSHSSSPTHLDSDSSSIPNGLRESMTRTIDIVVDFILNALDGSPEETVPPKDELELRKMVLATPSGGNADRAMLPVPLAVVLWNDEKHSFGEVQAQLVDLIGMSAADAIKMAELIDSEGRATIHTSPSVQSVLHIAKALSQIDLGVTVRRASETFNEQLASVLIEWLVDLMRTWVFGLQNGTATGAGEGDGSIVRELVAGRLFLPRSSNGDVDEQRRLVKLAQANRLSDTSGNGNGISRLEWMFFYHTRLWKRPRFRLKDLYITMLSLSGAYKIQMAVKFSNVYNRLMDSYLLVDREAENSVKYFALQLFTVPSIAAHLVQQEDIISRLNGLIVAFFTERIKGKAILADDQSDVDLVTVNVDSPPFKSKRFMPMFSDLRYICSNASVKALIASSTPLPSSALSSRSRSQPPPPRDTTFLSSFLRTCRLFMGINPNKRAAHAHVEYEQEAWISVFNVTLSLSRVVKVYAEAYAGSDPRVLVQSILRTARDIIDTCSLARPGGLDRGKYSPIEWTRVNFLRPTDPNAAGEKVIEFDVLSGWVSFHHSMHWLLAELMKHVDLLAREKLVLRGISDEEDEYGGRRLKEVFMNGLDGDGKGAFTEDELLVMIEFPLRVIVMVAQIRSGLWVRNGFAIRGQLLHYREYMLRELCYDQDLFLMQAALILLPPERFLISLLHRFQLVSWFTGTTTQQHPVYEGTHLVSMLEELFYVLITLLTERANASKMSMDDIVRREAIHGLALGACSYSELCKRVAERIMDEASFDRALHSIANFKSPEGLADSGQYELKDELYDEVNPYFFHYTRNRREEVEGILKARLARKSGAGVNAKTTAAAVIVPKPLIIEDGPFIDLNLTFSSEAFIQIIAVGLYNTTLRLDHENQTAPPLNMDAIIDQIMHIIMFAIVEDHSDNGSSNGFIHMAASYAVPAADHSTIVHLLCDLEYNEKGEPIKNKIQWCLDQMEDALPEIIPFYRTAKPDKAQDANAANDLEAKKKAAKARQAAIMKKFAAQQKSFLESVGAEDESMSDGDGDTTMAADDDVETFDPTKDLGSCIVCQENLDTNKSFGALGFVQASRFKRQMPSGSSVHLTEVLGLPANLDDPLAPPNPPDQVQPSDAFNCFPNNSTEFGLHTSFCGHFMHVECFNVYTFSVEQRHIQQTQRNHPENIDREEFVCPLCKSLGNTLLPVYDNQSIQRPKPSPSSQTLSEWARGVDIELLRAPVDRQLEARQSVDGSGEFTFWTAEDARYVTTLSGDDAHKMVQTLRMTCESISQQTVHLHGRLPPQEGNSGGGMYLPRDLVAYTITSLEIAQRGNSRTGGSTVAENLSETSLHTIRSLLISLRKLAAIQFPERSDGGCTAIRHALVKRLMPQWNRDPLRLPLLFRDPLTILVEVAAVAPDFLRHATTLMYYSCLARTCLALVSLLAEVPGDIPLPDAPGDSVEIPYSRIFGDIRIFVLSVARHSPELERFCAQILRTHGDKFEKLVYSFSLPFIRQAAILARAVAGTPLPHPTNVNSFATEYERLMDVLQIPLVSQLSHHESLQAVLAGWSATYCVVHSISGLDCSITLEAPIVYRLAQLPRALDSLFTNPNALVCHRCNTVPTDAAICMFCGTVCCYQMHCCVDVGQRSQGECNMHMRECGGVVGLYFCVKRCAMLYLYAGNGSTAPPPYLDIHGEVDLGMRRGRRQYLHPRRLEELRKTWLNHGIPTFIARKLDAVIDTGGWDSI